MTRDEAIALMIRLEGGEANLKGDPGGHTKYGVTQWTLNCENVLRPGKYPLNVADLTSDQAAEIYRTEDWDKFQGDKLPHALAPLMLNMAINEGLPSAVILLHEVVGVTGAIVGDQTLAAIARWKSPYQPGQSLAEEFAAHVGVKYAALYAKEGQFELGWMRRLMRVYTLAISGC